MSWCCHLAPQPRTRHLPVARTVSSKSPIPQRSPPTLKPPEIRSSTTRLFRSSRLSKGLSASSRPNTSCPFSSVTGQSPRTSPARPRRRVYDNRERARNPPGCAASIAPPSRENASGFASSSAGRRPAHVASFTSAVPEGCGWAAGRACSVARCAATRHGPGGSAGRVPPRPLLSTLIAGG